MKWMGIDYGEKRIGIALSNADGTVAFPETVLQNGDGLFGEIEKIIQAHDINAVVLGESKNLKQEANPIQKDIERFGKKLEQELGVPVSFEPEFYTSAQVERDFEKNAMLDASAAALILQSFLDRRHTKENTS